MARPRKSEEERRTIQFGCKHNKSEEEEIGRAIVRLGNPSRSSFVLRFARLINSKKHDNAINDVGENETMVRD